MYIYIDTRLIISEAGRPAALGADVDGLGPAIVYVFYYGYSLLYSLLYSLF